jgi:hypothetical protein
MSIVHTNRFPYRVAVTPHGLRPSQGNKLCIEGKLNPLGAVDGTRRATMPINDLIDRLIEEHRGDVHGALQALLLLNERLEAELQYFYEQSNIDPPHRGTLH